MIVPSQRDDSAVRELRPAQVMGPATFANTTHKTFGMKHSPEISSQSGSISLVELLNGQKGWNLLYLFHVQFER